FAGGRASGARIVVCGEREHLSTAAGDAVMGELTGELIGFAAAGRKLGKLGRDGQEIHPSTLTRHALTGVKLRDGTRVKLRAVKVGSRWMTTESWLREFID